MHITTVPASLLFLRGQPAFMRARGWTVHAISSPGPELEAFGAAEGVAVHAVEMPRRITPLADLAAVRRLWSILRAIRPDVVHAHTPKGGLLGMVAARLAGVPLRVYHVHGLPHLTRTGWRRRLLVTTERISCALASDVLCVSRSNREVLAADGICPPSRVGVFAGGSVDGVDADRFRPADTPARAAARTRLGLPPEAPVVGFVGRLSRDKGLVELAVAWAEVRREHPSAHLLLVGPLEDNDPVPGHVLAALRADPRARLRGEDWDTPALYAAMDVVVVPSHREGLGMVALEAGASGLPFVGCDIPGTRDAVVAGETGTLVPPRDPAALAVAIGRYLADPVLARTHGFAARQRALDLFSPARIREELAALYERPA